jgi:hypothetical protein
MIFSSVTVSPQAQQAYLAKNPTKAPVAGTSKNAAGGSSMPVAASPAPLGTSQSLKRTANAAHLDEAGVTDSVSKKKKL